jgi:hypothetical protein
MLESLRNLWNKHLKPSGVEIALFLLDDFHYFPIGAEESSYLTLRAIFQELVNQNCNYSLVVTANPVLFTQLADIAEPLLRFCKRFDLKPFAFKETREAIDKRLDTTGSHLKVDDESVRSIVEKTGGHPYLLMFTMYELLTLLKNENRIQVGLFEKTWPRVEQILGRNIFLYKFESATAKERDILMEMGRLEGNEFAPSDFRTIKGAGELLSRLDQKEFVVKLGRGKYALFHPLFLSYLRTRAAK